MGRVIAFSEFNSYYQSIKGRPGVVSGAIFDANILISLTYEVARLHDEVREFFRQTLAAEYDKGMRFFTTVNTRAEFLDFYRRLIMTENLRDITEDSSAWSLPSKAKAQIQYQSGLLKRREQHGSDPTFSDSQIKAIKSSFSANRFSGHAGWLTLCEKVLKNRLDIVEENLEKFCVEYISQHIEQQKDLFNEEITWPPARRLAEQSCMGFSDAMILNAAQCSRFPCIVSTDFDIGYAALASPTAKDVIMPDSVADQYRHFHFDGLG
jgi:hypothetical protein